MLAEPRHIGDDLKAERERAGRTLESVAEELNIPARYLSAIERGTRDGLPGVGYVLGYVRAFAGEVGYDGELAVDRYKSEQAIPENLRLRDAPHIVVRRRARALPRGIVPAVLVLLAAVGFALYYGWQSGRADMGPRVDDTPAAAQPALTRDTVVIRAETASWIEIRTGEDRAVAFSGIMVPGQALAFSRADLPVINVRDAGAVRLELGADIVGPLGRRGQSLEGLSAEEVIARPRADTPAAATAAEDTL